MGKLMPLLLVMELWRLRAREFLSARSTHDRREDESLAEALSSPKSAAMNWRHRDREGKRHCQRGGQSAAEKPITCPLVSACHLLFLQGNLGFDGQDQIRCVIPQLANVLIDVAFHLQPHVVVHMPGEDKNTKQICCWCFLTFFFFIQSRGQNRNWIT